jgi:hypothetical protein
MSTTGATLVKHTTMALSTVRLAGKPPFFRDIRIYGMDQHKFAEYVLINPLITNWRHDQYNYSEGGWHHAKFNDHCL